MRDQGQERRAAETSEQREERLQSMRDQEHKRCGAEDKAL